MTLLTTARTVWWELWETGLLARFGKPLDGLLGIELVETAWVPSEVEGQAIP